MGTFVDRGVDYRLKHSFCVQRHLNCQSRIKNNNTALSWVGGCMPVIAVVCAAALSPESSRFESPVVKPSLYDLFDGR